MINKVSLAICVTFITCCSNVFLLEAILKEDPAAGNLVTFLRFLFIATVGFCTIGEFGTAKRKIPLLKYLLFVFCFWASSVANSYAFSFNISMPLHMIFRSGSLLANMALGVWILKKRYPFYKYLAIVMVSVGIAICTIQSSTEVKARREAHEDSIEEEKLLFIDWIWWCFGIVMLTLSLFLRARLSIFQETLYSQYGRYPLEVMYYTHLLPLLFWIPSAQNLIHHVHIATHTLPINIFGIALPRQILYLLLFIIMKAICTSAVSILTSECSALTVSLTLTLRKVVSLLISVYYFKNTFTLGHWIGTCLVFLGTLIFTETIQKSANLIYSKMHKNKIE